MNLSVKLSPPGCIIKLVSIIQPPVKPKIKSGVEHIKIGIGDNCVNKIVGVEFIENDNIREV